MRLVYNFQKRGDSVRTFEDFIYSHFDTDAEFCKALKWDRNKLYRIKSGQQIPKITDVNDIARSTHTPLTDVAQMFLS